MARHAACDSASFTSTALIVLRGRDVHGLNLYTPIGLISLPVSITG